MINYKEKPLEQLTLEETIEFEKEMRKKALAAARNGMSEMIVDQLNVYLSLITEHKRACMHIRSMDGAKEDGVVLTLGEWDEDEQELSDDSE